MMRDTWDMYVIGEMQHDCMAQVRYNMTAWHICTMYMRWDMTTCQCVAVCCSVLQCVAVCCSVLHQISFQVYVAHTYMQWDMSTCHICATYTLVRVTYVRHIHEMRLMCNVRETWLHITYDCMSCVRSDDMTPYHICATYIKWDMTRYIWYVTWLYVMYLICEIRHDCISLMWYGVMSYRACNIHDI